MGGTIGSDVQVRDRPTTAPGGTDPFGAAEQSALVLAAQRGDERALRLLFDGSCRTVMAVCLAATRGDRERARDLSQETFAMAFAALSTVREPARFMGWLLTIANNVCHRRCGQDARRRRILECLALEQDAPPVLEPTSEASRDERIAIVRDVLARISDETLRAIVQLKYGEPEHTTREIARRLDIPHGTVTVKLMRFRAGLRGELLRALAEDAPEGKVPS